MELRRCVSYSGASWVRDANHIALHARSAHRTINQSHLRNFANGFRAARAYP